MKKRGTSRILILTYERIKDTINCIMGLTPTLGESDHVYVLDNGSKSPIKEFLEYWKHTDGGKDKFTTFYSPENLGVSKGRKFLVDNSPKEADFTVFLDSDVRIINNNWLLSMKSYLSDIENSLVAVCGIGASNMRHDWSSFYPAIENPVDSVAGFCQVWRKMAFDQVEMDSDSFPLFWAEDSDLCFQAISKGWEVHALPINGFMHMPAHSGYGQDQNLWARNMETLKKKWAGKGVIRAERLNG